MITGYYRVHMIIRGYVRTDVDHVDYDELDVRIWNAEEELAKQTRWRKPRLELNYYDEFHGLVEVLFIFRITWQDRQADIDEYVEEAMKTIESITSMIVDEYEVEAVVPDQS